MDLTMKMDIALDIARIALNKGELPVSAVVFYGDEIISQAYTSEKSDNRYLVHAELKALLEADLRQFPIRARKEMQLFTTLEPCIMCLGAAMTFFVGEIYYALEAPVDGAVKLVEGSWEKGCKVIPAYKTPKIVGGIRRNEARRLFQEYIEANVSSPMYEYVKSLVR